MQTILTGLAAYRLTRMVTTDTIFDRPRIWVFRRFPPPGSWQTVGKAGGFLEQPRPPHWLGKLLSCSWCAGFWVAGALVLAEDHWPAETHTAIGWLAAATIVGLVAGTVGD